MTAKILLYILSGSGLLYLLILFTFTMGWYRLKYFTASTRHFSTKISVVVAFRNESKNLRNLLTSLCNQTYPEELLEIILVNDHSEDESLSVIKAFLKQNKNCKIVVLEANEKGKKTALHQGINKASGSLIVTTDADCTSHKNWLVKLSSFYEEEKPLLVLGPVVYSKEQGWLQQFFSMEFLSLVASGAGSAASHLPIMGNGANMAFEKDVFLEAGIEAQKQQYASGDDVFLIHYLTQKYGRHSIRFIKNKEATTHTPPPQNWKEFMEQRVRWGSKAKGYSLAWPILVTFVVLIFNLFLVTAFVYGFITPWFWSIFILFILLKFLVDLPLLKDFAEFTDKNRLMPYLFPFEVVYPFYIVIAAVKGLFFSYNWKGRKVH